MINGAKEERKLSLGVLFQVDVKSAYLRYYARL